MQDINNYTVSTAVLAEALGVSAPHVNNLRKQGTFPYALRGKTVYLYHKDCLDYTIRELNTARKAGLNKEPKHVIAALTNRASRDPHRASRDRTNKALLLEIDAVTSRLVRIETKLHAIMTAVGTESRPTIGSMVTKSISR